MKKKYYIVKDAPGGQHGSFIETVELTSKEYHKALKTKNRGYAIFKEYIQAIYYIQDWKEIKRKWKEILKTLTSYGISY